MQKLFKLNLRFVFLKNNISVYAETIQIKSTFRFFKKQYKHIKSTFRFFKK